jgi:ATP-dependent Clp protease ATP-binding subunit ClpX
MDDKEKCNFCGEFKSTKDVIIHKDNDGVAVGICRTCVSFSARKVFKMKGICDDEQMAKKKEQEPNTDIMTPKKIFGELQKYIIGQDAALAQIATFGYSHIRRIQMMSEGHDSDKLPRKSTALLYGPTGVGKTHTLTVLGKILNVPVGIADVSSVTQIGYVGDDPADLLKCVLRGEEGAFTNAIICLDEFCKISKKIEARGGKDINGFGIQIALLKLIEGTVVDVPFWLDGKGQKRDAKTVPVDTDKISFVAAGAFSDMDDFRDEGEKIGFRNKQNNVTTEQHDFSDMLIKYGIIPELVSRFSSHIKLDNLSIVDLKRILIEPIDSLVKKEKERFYHEGFNLEIDDSALTLVAESAYRSKLGARYLQKELSGVLDTMAFELFGTNQNETVIVYSCNGELKTKVVKMTERQKRKMI